MSEQENGLQALGPLDGFEVWDKNTDAPAGLKPDKKAAWVSVLMSGGLGLNKVARFMLGEDVRAVKIMFDRQRKRIGFVPTDPEDGNSYDITSTCGCQIQCRKLLEYYGITVEKTTRCYDLEVIDGILIANL